MVLFKPMLSLPAAFISCALLVICVFCSFLFILPNQLVYLDNKLLHLLIFCLQIGIFGNHYFRVLGLPLSTFISQLLLKKFTLLHLVLSFLLLYSFLGLGFSTNCVLWILGILTQLQWILTLNAMNFELRAPCLVRKELYHFTHTTTPFCVGYYQENDSKIVCLGLALNLGPTDYLVSA
jgi:hypothetical protein